MWYYNSVRRGYTPDKADRHQLQNGKRTGGVWKDFPKNFSKLLKKVLTRLAESAIMIVQGKGTPSLVVKKSFQKTFEKPLDKPLKV